MPEWDSDFVRGGGGGGGGEGEHTNQRYLNIQSSLSSGVYSADPYYFRFDTFIVSQ